jgi:hypothetical protein
MVDFHSNIYKEKNIFINDGYVRNYQPVTLREDHELRLFPKNKALRKAGYLNQRKTKQNY